MLPVSLMPKLKLKKKKQTSSALVSHAHAEVDEGMLQLQPDSLARSVSRGPGICHLFPPRQRAEGNEIVKICDSSAISDGATSALECLRVPPGFQLWVSGGPCSLLPTANMPHLCRGACAKAERSAASLPEGAIHRSAAGM